MQKKVMPMQHWALATIFATMCQCREGKTLSRAALSLIILILSCVALLWRNVGVNAQQIKCGLNLVNSFSLPFTLSPSPLSTTEQQALYNVQDGYERVEGTAQLR